MSFASVCASVRLYHMTVEEEISSKITFYKDVVNVSHPTKKKSLYGWKNILTRAFIFRLYSMCRITQECS